MMLSSSSSCFSSHHCPIESSSGRRKEDEDDELARPNNTTSSSRQKGIDDDSSARSRRRRTVRESRNNIMKLSSSSSSLLLLALLALQLVLVLVQFEMVSVVSSFVHRPPMAFVGTSHHRKSLLDPSAFLSTITSTGVGKQQAMHAAVLQTKLWSSSSSSSSSTQQEEDSFVKAQDLDALQALFSKYCDKEGLMSKSNVQQIPAIAQLLEDGDLMPEEFSDIWEKASKFPDVVAAAVSSGSSKSSEERIDVDSFVQVYRDIDDLFEEDDDDDDDASTPESAEASAKDFSGGSNEEEDQVIADVTADTAVEAELEASFATIASKRGKGKAKKLVVSRNALRAWDEVDTLVADGMLSEEEFQDLWESSPKVGKKKNVMDLDGFLTFNDALDDLFDFEDDEVELDDLKEEGEEDDDDSVESTTTTPSSSVEGEEDDADDEDDLSPSEIFDKIKDSSGFVDLPDLKKWDELNEMIEDGELLASELEQIFEAAPKSPDDATKLDKDGFIALAATIDSLFEDVDGDDDGDETSAASISSPSPAPAAASEESAPVPAPSGTSVRQDLMRALEIVNGAADDMDDEDEGGRLPCGLESTETESTLILDLVDMLEKEPSNIIRQRDGAITNKDLAGTWDMVYTSSSAMKFNKGLSGLGGSFPNGKFGGLRQILTETKFLADVEYIEHIKVKPDTASFDVKVTGDWDLRSSVSLFTGEPSIVLTVVPDRVTYGPTSTRADHWKSLGPLNMLDVTYLDEDIRIMRGNTSVENIFIFRRASS